MIIVVKIILLSALVTAPITLHAKSQALLVGIGQYPGDMALEGPVNDVALISDLLSQSEQISEVNIVELINEEATRKNIIDALSNLQKTTESGDKVIVYFSGHGTSALDDNIDADIPPNSGALVPYDIASIASRKELNERLLVGSRDLRPVLSKLDDAGIEILVLVDACFSGNVVRGKKGFATLPAKFLDFSKLLQKLSLGEKSAPIAPEKKGTTVLIETEDYPYRNVYLIAAANEGQAAQDIPSSRVEDYPTVDSKPHGAFTDSLVRALVNLYEYNSEQNTSSTLAELHTATRILMRDRKFLSRPRLLPEDKGRTEAITLQRFFGQSIGFD